MDQELKQRLIGASVIIALAVIFIPMLFDNEVSQESSKKIDIVIPEPGTNELTVKSFSLDDTNQAEEAVSDNLPNSDLALEDNALTVTDSASANGLIESPDNMFEGDKSEEGKPEEDGIKEQPNPAEDNKTEADEKAVSQVTEDMAKPTVSDTKAVSSDENQQSEKLMVFRVKLGSFSQAENAQQLKNKLAQKGIGTLIELAPDKGLYRVWSEALYSNKDKAELYVTEVNKLKLNIGQPKIIKVSEQDVKKASDQGQLGWVVQLGSFAARDNALDLRNKLKLAGFSTAFVDQSKNSRGELRYRLRVGPMNSQQQATQSKQQILGKLKLDGLVKPHELAPLVD